MSGSFHIPVTGFDNTPKIRFTNDERLPTVSMCDISITFPRRMGLLDYENFKQKMVCIRLRFNNSNISMPCISKHMDMVIYPIPHWCKLGETGISKPQFSCLQSLDWWTVLTFIFMLPNETSSLTRKMCNLIHNQRLMAFSFRIFQQPTIMHC